jgi:hypothetical protein
MNSNVVLLNAVACSPTGSSCQHEIQYVPAMDLPVNLVYLRLTGSSSFLAKAGCHSLLV